MVPLNVYVNAASVAVGAYVLYFTLKFLLVHRRRSLVKQKHGCLPAPKLYQKDPFLGTDLVLQNRNAGREHRFLDLLKARHDKGGLTYTTDTYFRRTINTCDPDLIRNVLAFQFNDFGMGPLRQRSAAPLLGQGIFTTDHETWSQQRALIRPSFYRARVTNLSIYKKHVDRLIAIIREENCKTDLQPLFVRLTLDTNSEYLFGESVGLLSDQPLKHVTNFYRALNYAGEATIQRLRLGNLMWFHHDREFKRCCAIVHEFAQQFVDKALDFRRRETLVSPDEKDVASGERQKYLFIDELAKATDNPTRLRDHIVNMLLAADTTPGLLSFAFYMLSRNEVLWEKLRNHVLEHYCEPLTYEALMNMTYLRHFIQECLRLFPPIATNSRVAHKDTVLPVGGGPDGKSPLFIAKHNVVTYSTYVMHRRKDLFGEDADEFRPERWEKLLPGWEYLPFNGGPRMCPGQKLAMTETSYTIARILTTFSSIESLDNSEWQEKITLSLKLKNGIQCHLIS
ncbi:hypothetical protein UA08_09184 [Talaromyces atroroseus]|uniref:Cytochrome P450 n=1 Tax=Talaromyces atroroseus TaxID=1441469 RepID=A0A1Q5Q729_TALAT|nr:hypothetical protein UA08_09184 [Talaromyces atroroseus]OKL55491.1 hypothetical protein UA08_09184 [Talaromyces atroroseus]